MKILFILFLSFAFWANGQNVLVRGNLINFPDKVVPFSIQNLLFKYQPYLVKKNEDSTFKINLNIESPTIVYVAYKKIFIEPNDTIDFTFSFSPSLINKYDNRISVASKYPGNLLYYDFLERKILSFDKLKNTDSVSVYRFIDNSINEFNSLKDSINSFIQLNTISPTFKTFLQAESPYYIISFLLEELQWKNVEMSLLTKKIITQLIKSVKLNMPFLARTSTYYSKYLFAFQEYWLLNELKESSKSMFQKKLNWTFINFSDDAKDLAITGLTRMNIINGSIKMTDGDNNFFFNILNEIKNDTAKRELIDFVNYYSKFNQDSIGLIKFINHKNKIFTFKEILQKNKNVKLIDFWASWCGPCIVQIPYLNQLKDSISSLQILSLSIDANKDEWKRKIRKIRADYKNDYCIYDSNESNKLSVFLKLQSIPRFLIVNSTGKIVFYWAEEPIRAKRLIDQIKMVN